MILQSIIAAAAARGRRNRIKTVSQAPSGGSSGPGANPPVWSGLPATLDLTQGGTLDIRSYASDPDGDALTFALELGTLPTGVTFANGVFTAAADATLGESGDLTVSADDGYTAPATMATSFTLTSPSSGTMPFTIGLGFKEGDATDIVTDLANYQVDVKRRWLDGSVKHAIISGRAALTADVPLVVNVTPGTPPSGTALTAANITAAAPTASVQCGSIGAVSLADLLASPFRTWISGPELVECHYRADVGGGTLLAVWFHVRLYASGHVRVRAIVENGYLDDGAGAVAVNADQTYDATVTIGGAQVYAEAGLAHYKLTSWMAEGWIGGDPAVTPSHDTAYLRASKLVPNYTMGTKVSTNTDNGVLQVSNGSTIVKTLAGLKQVYTPMTRGDLEEKMWGTGFQPQIGLLPHWDALYISTGGDARAWRTMLANTSHLHSYAILRRSATTKLPVTPSAFPTWTTKGPGGNGDPSPAAGTLDWDLNHHGSAGYLAYLLTGDYHFYETMALQCATVYCSIASGAGSGVDRFLNAGQTRGMGWSLRTIAQFAGIAPDADETAADYRTLLANNYTRLATYCNAPTASPIGLPFAISTYDETKPLSVAPWMYHFFIASNGHAWDIEPGFADKSAHQTVRDFMYRAAVGILGGSGVENYCYTKASVYTYTISSLPKEPDTAWTDADKFFSTWGEVYEATFGVENTACGTALEGTGGADPKTAATGYWGNLMPAIAYAVDHGATDAQAAWARLTSAANWGTDVIGAQVISWDDAPLWGVTPR